MGKCSVVGCGKDGVSYPYPIYGGAFTAEIIACSMEHFEQCRKSLEGV